MNDKQIAEKILKFSGGEQNIKGVTHCVTRLRLSVNNIIKIQIKEIQSLPNVLGVNVIGNQLQVILGGKVVDVYDEFIPLVNISSASTSKDQNEGLISKLLDTLSGIFTPILPAIIGAGMLKGVMVFLIFYKLAPTDADLFKFLNIFSDSAFYFLPILLAVSTATRFNCNKYSAIAIAGILIHPNLIAMMTGADSTSFFGIPVTKASYASSVLPIILGIWVMSYVERWLMKIVSKILRMILVPVLTLWIVTPIILVVLGPIGTIVGDVIGKGFINFYLNYGIFAGAVLGAVYPFLVILGMHVGFTPVMVQSLSTFGVDYMMGLFVASNSAQAGATFAVYTKTKNKEFKPLAGTAALNAIIGITEPALFGVTTKLKKPLIAVSVGGAIGGAIAGAFHVQASGMGTGPIAGIPLFLGQTFIYFVISSIIAFVIGYVLTLIIGFDDIPEENAQATTGKIDEKASSEVIADQKILSPLSGEIVNLENVKDKTFAEKMMGDGIAIKPNNGKVIAPFDGVVGAVFGTKHAIGLKSNNGCELLIHIGIDTVELNGKGYVSHVKNGDTISAGELLVEFDIDAIQKAGYDTITPIIVTNSNMYENIQSMDSKNIKSGDSLLELTAKK